MIRKHPAVFVQESSDFWMRLTTERPLPNWPRGSWQHTPAVETYRAVAFLVAGLQAAARAVVRS